MCKIVLLQLNAFLLFWYLLSCSKSDESVETVHRISTDRGHCLSLSHDDRKDVSSMMNMAPYQKGDCPPTIKLNEESFSLLKSCPPFKSPHDNDNYLYQVNIYEARLDSSAGLVSINSESSEAVCDSPVEETTIKNKEQPAENK